jgi:hypothetical protein
MEEQADGNGIFEGEEMFSQGGVDQNGSKFDSLREI